jgi:glycosyltransferase involved in cell wall biosynthesis
MKLLIFTQKVDMNDPILGFFHNWIKEFSKYTENIIVVCLYQGKCELPENVKVLSLGKENGESRIKYLKNFFKYIWNERKNYDKVFVHMNQEYILLGGWFWKLLGKDIYMWRNHYAGSILTDIASLFCKNVFCTSRYSYTAKYKKTLFMPVGVDLNIFKPDPQVERKLNQILFLARISPSKRPEMFIKAIANISKLHPSIVANIYGDPQAKDIAYHESLKKMVKDLNMERLINFKSGISNLDTVRVYSSHNIFINLSPSGMYDKTIFEAMASGCLVLTSNDNLRGQIENSFIFKEGDESELRDKLNILLNYTNEEREKKSEELQNFALKHSLKNLCTKLFESIK